MTAIDKYYIEDKVVVITGDAGLLGCKHAEAVIEGKGIAVLLDVLEQSIEKAINSLKEKYGNGYIFFLRRIFSSQSITGWKARQACMKCLSNAPTRLILKRI